MKTKLVYKFIVPVILMLIVAGISTNYLVNLKAHEVLVGQATAQISKIVQLQAKTTGVTAVDFQQAGNAKADAKFQKIFQQIHTNDVIRIKVWRPDGTIIYSDDRSLIGRNFGADDDIGQATKTGTAVSDITKPNAAENVDEHGFPEFMEIYTPIMPNGRTPAPGVFEVYYKLNGLENAVKSFRIELFFIRLVTFTILVLLLLYVLSLTVIRPVRAMQLATNRIARGNLKVKVKVNTRDEIGQLGHSLNSMATGLERLEQLKNEFVFVGAHELRAPVSVIKGYLGMIDLNPEKKDEYLAEIRIANKRLEQLVDDLLEIARADSGKLKIQLAPTDICRLCEEAVKFFQPLAKERNITLEYEKPANTYTIMADEIRLKEVLTNLVSNAVKYGRENGHIKLYHEEKDGHLLTFIEDDGNGIPEDDKKHIFEKFYRTEEARKSVAVGTGLGLFITKELVERMDGVIGFESQTGNGTKFFVEFKLSP